MGSQQSTRSAPPQSKGGKAGSWRPFFFRVRPNPAQGNAYFALDLGAPPLYNDVPEEGRREAAAVQNLAELCRQTGAFREPPAYHTGTQRKVLGRIERFSAQGATTVPHREWCSVTHICDWLQEANRSHMVPAFLKACGLDNSNEYAVAQAGHSQAGSQ